ncbi:MAG: lytic transglycosylase domain-containing protein [Deltaproteobacteria bacterium]|nr:lytic transglycosylase domain-containing protein [Deltaproteobacteria bacterium]
MASAIYSSKKAAPLSRKTHVPWAGIFFFLLASFNCQFVLADIYRFVDKNGVVHFSNVPTDPRYRLYISGGGRNKNHEYARYKDVIREMSTRYKVDEDLIRAVIKAESDFDPSVVSHRGARGLMQLMPETALDMNVKNVFDPRENIEGGVKYLRRLLNMFDNDLPLTLAAYNAGENIVKEHGCQIPPYRETHVYIKKVLRYLQDYKRTKQ